MRMRLLCFLRVVHRRCCRVRRDGGRCMHPTRVCRAAYKFNEGGWTYVHLQGTPEQVGFQHGYLLAREIEDNVHVYQVEAPHHAKRDWSFFRDAAQNVLWPHLDAEYQEELKGIAEG